MTLSRINHLGAAAGTTLNGSITAGATSATLSGTVTGYPSANFVIKIDAGTANEEKILVGSRTGMTISSLTRGYDGTSATSHSSGAAVEHDLAAVVIDDANDHIYTTSRDDHTQYARTDGTRTVTGSQTFSAGIHVTSGGANVTGGGTFDTLTASTTGATAASRYIGATTGGPPASGTHSVGDFAIDNTTGAVWVCVTAGTPGTFFIQGSKYSAEMYCANTHGTFTGGLIPYDTGANDFNSNLNLVNNQYTVPLNGVYAVSAGIGVTLGTNANVTLQINKNGVGTPIRNIGYAYSSGGTVAVNVCGVTQYYFAAGDLIGANLLVNSGSISPGLVASRTATYFNICLLGQH